MQIEHLRYLIEISKAGSISKAAENLFISQQGLSKAIQTLEKQLGVPILNRTCNKISFTDEGQIVLEKSEEIIAKMNELMVAVNAPADPAASACEANLTLFCTPFFSVIIMPKLLHQFRLKYPNVKLFVMEKRPSQLIEDICGTPHALGLLNITEYEYNPSFFDDHNLRYTIFNECEYTVLVAKDSPLAAQPFVTVEEISKNNLALLDFEQMNSVYEHLFIDKPNIVLKTVNQDLYADTIAAGSAIGLTTASFYNFSKNYQVVTVPIKPSVKFYIGCICCKESAHNTNIRLFQAIMTKFFKNPNLFSN